MKESIKNKTEEFCKIKKSLLEENLIQETLINFWETNRRGRWAVRWNSEGQLPPRATKEMVCSREHQGDPRLCQQVSQSRERAGGGEQDEGGSWATHPASHLQQSLQAAPPSVRTDKHLGVRFLKEQSQLWQQEMRDGLRRCLMWILLSRSKTSLSGHFWGEAKPHTHTHTQLYFEFLLKGEVG